MHIWLVISADLLKVNDFTSFQAIVVVSQQRCQMETLLLQTSKISLNSAWRAFCDS